MTKYCYKCGKIVNDHFLRCPDCDGIVSSTSDYYISSGTTTSGETFSVSSATAVSPSFEKISAEFKNSLDSIITLDYFQRANIKEDTLEYYVGIGYLKKITGDKYKLSELGKQVYLKNLEFKQKVNENIEKINFDE